MAVRDCAGERVQVVSYAQHPVTFHRLFATRQTAQVRSAVAMEEVPLVDRVLMELALADSTATRLRAAQDPAPRPSLVPEGPVELTAAAMSVVH